MEAIVNSGQCAAAMRTGEMRQTDTLDENSPKQLVTPLRDLIREWPDLGCYSVLTFFFTRMVPWEVLLSRKAYFKQG